MVETGLEVKELEDTGEPIYEERNELFEVLVMDKGNVKQDLNTPREELALPSDRDCEAAVTPYARGAQPVLQIPPSNAIHRHLSRHYILKRSIVFIVDQDFSSTVLREQAMKIVLDTFDSMPPTDQFGLLHLRKPRNSSVILEPKGRNTQVKRRLLQSI